MSVWQPLSQGGVPKHTPQHGPDNRCWGARFGCVCLQWLAAAPASVARATAAVVMTTRIHEFKVIMVSCDMTPMCNPYSPNHNLQVKCAKW